MTEVTCSEKLDCDVEMRTREATGPEDQRGDRARPPTWTRTHSTRAKQTDKAPSHVREQRTKENHETETMHKARTKQTRKRRKRTPIDLKRMNPKQQEDVRGPALDTERSKRHTATSQNADDARERGRATQRDVQETRTQRPTQYEGTRSTNSRAERQPETGRNAADNRSPDTRKTVVGRMSPHQPRKKAEKRSTRNERMRRQAAILERQRRTAERPNTHSVHQSVTHRSLSELVAQRHTTYRPRPKRSQAAGNEAGTTGGEVDTEHTQGH